MAKPFYIISLLYFLPMGIFWPLWQVNLLSRGLDPSNIAILVAISSIIGCLLELPTGITADVLGRKMSCLFAVCLLSLGFLFLAMGNGIVFFTLAIALITFGQAFYSGALTAWMYSTVKKSHPKVNRKKLFAAIQIYQRIGVIIGAVFGGHLAYYNIYLPWYLAVSTYIALFIFILVQTKEEYGHKSYQNHLKNIFIIRPQQAVKDFYQSQKLITLGIAVALWGLSDSIGQTLFFPYMKSLSGQAIWIMGYIQLGLSGSRLIGALYLYKYLSIKNSRQTLINILLLNSLLYFIFSFTKNFYFALGLMVFRVFLLGIYFSVLNAIINEHTPEQSRASLNSLFAMIVTFFTAIGAFILSQINIFYYSQALWLTCAIIIILTAVVLLRLEKDKKAEYMAKIEHN